MRTVMVLSSPPNKVTNFFLKITLYTGGIFFKTEKITSAEILNNIVITIASIILSTGAILALINAQNFNIRMEICSNIFSFNVCLILYWGMRHYRQNLIQATDGILKPTTRTGMSIEKATQRIENYVRKYLLVIAIFYITCFVTYLSISFFITFIKKDYNSSEAYVVPFWFQCKNSEKLLIKQLIAFICWTNSTFLQYLISNTILVLLFFVATLTCITTFLYYLLVMMYAKEHSNAIILELKLLTSQLNADLKIIPKRMAKNMKSKRKSYPMEKEHHTYSKSVQSKNIRLTEIVCYYQKLYSVVITCRPTLCFFAGCHFSFQYALMTSSLFSIMGQFQTEMSYTHVLKQMMTAGSFFFIIIILCWGGEIISSINSAIAEHVYNLPWADFPEKEFRLKVYQFLLLLNKPINIVTIGTSIVNLRAFMFTANRVYSMINLLLAKSKLH